MAGFEWDPEKAAANARKHRIQFADAVLVLEDERVITLRDDTNLEERWITALRQPRANAAISGALMKREYDFSKGKTGPVVSVPAGKTRVTIRLDDDILDWFRDEVDRAGGGNYQSLINRALRDFVARTREPLESTLRRVIREELKRAG